ncbi:MAG: DUF262 domain-containing protein [Candidatus Chloroheliales bacterium]|nr:MAG: DUF262 domain-containing protein [Chloroflexota bacterium]
MRYLSDTIANTISRINRQYFLPAIQREFVWQPDQVIKLFDSIMRGYPIGSFLFWELEPENRDKWELYYFIQDFKTNMHNQLASTDGVQNCTLILDGQQRLTSLLIGLKGTYTTKRPKLWWNNPAAWIHQSLYLDLLQNPGADDDDTEESIRYGFRFFENPPANSKDYHWIKVGRILDCITEENFEELRETEENNLNGSITLDQRKTFVRNLGRLYRSVWKDDVIAYYTEKEQDYDRVLTIFVRANQGGTKLSKSDLLLSMVTAKWGAVNAREEIYDFVDHLNSELTRKNNFDKDFVMKNCLVLTDLPVQYRVENFTNQNLEKIYKLWPLIRSSIERAVKLINTFGLDRDTFSTANALIPIIYYFSKHPRLTLLGTTPTDVANAERIRRWLLAILLNRVFQGLNDTALAGMRQAIREQPHDDTNFPVESINTELRRIGRRPTFDDEAIERFLDITYGEQESFLALTLLYDEKNWGLIPYHEDHIFPRSLFNITQMTRLNIAEDKQQRFIQLSDHIGNLQLLTGPENVVKQDKPFEDWIATRHSSFQAKHLIPADPSLYAFDRFDEFVVAREQMIRQRLNNEITLAKA